MDNETAPPTPYIEKDDDFEVLEFDDLKKNISRIFLEPKYYYEYLNELKQQGKKPDRETFCEGFFISSFSKSNGKVIEMSSSFRPDCGHFECSELPAMKSEIIYKYPLQETKALELINLAASTCFPNGIKVCYDEKNGPNEIKNYTTSITTQKGEKYYVTNYHFYLKYRNAYYNKEYVETPLKYNLRKDRINVLSINEEQLTDNKNNNIIQNNSELNKKLKLKNIVYIPYCICLISKYPYIQEMQKCLKSIYTIIKNPDSDVVINDLIMYLINAIPIPKKKTRIKFLLPYYNKSIIIEYPKLKDIYNMNFSVSSLLYYFSIDNLILIFRLLISEKKILLIDDDYQRLSTVADGLVSILYPLQWTHTYKPIISYQMINYLDSFLPFLIGIDKSLMHLVVKNIQENKISINDEIFLIYINENTIQLSSTLKRVKKKMSKYIKDNIPSLPSGLEKELESKLKKAKGELEHIKKNKIKNTIKNRQNCELLIRDCFIDLFVEMFEDYEKYLTFVEQEPIFNRIFY